MGCPNSTEAGCRCPEHDPGLMEHTHDIGRYAQALEPLRGPTVTSIPHGTIVCDGRDMTCRCAACATERAQRVRAGAAPSAQPWAPRPPRTRPRSAAA